MLHTRWAPTIATAFVGENWVKRLTTQIGEWSNWRTYLLIGAIYASALIHSYIDIYNFIVPGVKLKLLLGKKFALHGTSKIRSIIEQLCLKGFCRSVLFAACRQKNSKSVAHLCAPNARLLLLSLDSRNCCCHTMVTSTTNSTSSSSTSSKRTVRALRAPPAPREQHRYGHGHRANKQNHLPPLMVNSNQR